MAYRDQEGGDRSGRRRRVLIVDDEPAIVDLLAFLFEDEGYEVLRAYDGEQGLRLAKRVHPDLVISDVSMPRLTGLDLLDGLRANGSRETPVILMSAVVRDVPAERCVFVPKPFDLDRMLALARTQLAAR
jgi:CheY-like chemotaxis protein